ncbi:MAG: cell division protein FtsA [Dehalococcoidales bacterium]|nr:cell division protein FtsA [Dehalococcoidales bacterium]
MKNNRIAAIDVGTTKICTIMAEVDENGLPTVLGVGVVPSNGLHKGMVADFKDAKESIQLSVMKAEQAAGYKMESACVGITGKHISSVNNHGVVSITHARKIVHPGDLERVLKIARDIELPQGREILHVIPRSYALDGQTGINSPVGMHANRLDAETNIITAASTSVQNLAKCVRSSGVKVEDIVLEPLASAEAVLTEEEKQDGSILLDIGGGTTDVVVFQNGSAYYAFVLPVSGYHITRDVSIAAGISFDLAEEIKIKYGNVIPFSGSLPDKKDIVMGEFSISHDNLTKIISTRLEELLRLVMIELSEINFPNVASLNMVLSGGSANIPGLAELAVSTTRLPARIGYPFRLPGVSDALSNPMHATGVGLLLWKLINDEKQSRNANYISRLMGRNI